MSSKKLLILSLFLFIPNKVNATTELNEINFIID